VVVNASRDERRGLSDRHRSISGEPGPNRAGVCCEHAVNTDEGDTYPFEEVGAWLEEAGFVKARTLASP
jgi:hypothetical protein